MKRRLASRLNHGSLLYLSDGPKGERGEKLRFLGGWMGSGVAMSKIGMAIAGLNAQRLLQVCASFACLDSEVGYLYL